MSNNTFYWVISSLLINLLIFASIDRHYNSKYVRLRAEVIMETGVDISYPYKDDKKRLNKSWFGGRR